jgi:serine/threonine protein kinase
MESSVEHGLLLLVVSLQLGLITRDEFVRVLHAWTLDRATPLESLLAQLPSVKPAEIEQLSAIIRRQPLAAPQTIATAQTAAAQLIASQAQITSPASEPAPRQKLPAEPPHFLGGAATIPPSPAPHIGKRKDGEFKRREVHGEQLVTDRFVTQPPQPSPPPQSSTRYRVIGLHRPGGLADVYNAFDEELNRQVALKQIKPDRADDEDARAEFEFEAEVTGKLQHPAIVPVYSLSRFADGRPYYTMRFIEGMTLQEALEAYHDKNKAQDRSPADKALELRKLLRSFLVVCDAIEYAHHRGFIHRDIKPSNIIVGQYGETLVIDWGLAQQTADDLSANAKAMKLLHPASSGSTSSGSSKRSTGGLVGTVQYMSPEQASGRLNLIGHRSDIYSLGATLYHVLTGRAPFSGDDPNKIANDVRESAFPRPREVQRDIPPALDAICMRAMARTPSERYASARAMAEDIDHWLADEPVTALREPYSARALRYVRKHQVLSVAAAFAIVAAIVGGFISRKLADDRDNAQRVQAEATIALDALDDMFKELSSDTLPDEAAFNPLRRTLLKYYANFSKRKDSDPATREKIATAYVNMSDLTAAIGPKSEALTSIETASRIYQELKGTDPQAALKLAQAETKKAALLNEMGRYRESLASLKSATDALRAPNDQINEEQRTEALARALHHTGVALYFKRSYSEAEAALRQSSEEWGKLLERSPGESRYQQGLAEAQGWMGDVQLERCQWSAAREAYKDSHTQRESLASQSAQAQTSDDEPTEQVPNPERLFQLARSFANLGRLYSRASRSESDTAESVDLARSNFTSALDIQRKLVSERPRNKRYSLDLAYTLQWLGELCVDTDQQKQGDAYLDEAEKLLAALRKSDPGDLELQKVLARVVISRAKVALDASPDKPSDAAIALVAQAEELLTDLRSRSGVQDTGDYDAAYAMAELAGLNARVDPTDVKLAEATAKVADAIASGFTDIALVLRDRAFVTLRDRPGFKSSIANLRAKVHDREISR